MAKEDAQNSKLLDVTDAENHISVQVAEVRLHSSNLIPLTEEPADKLSKIAFHVSAVISGKTAYCKLGVEVIHIEGMEDAGETGYHLNFSLLGIFVGSENVSSSDMAEFAKMYTLSLLWPYAREYASDQFRRTGLPFTSLPVINPQVVTEKLIRGNYIKIRISGDDEK